MQQRGRKVYLKDFTLFSKERLSDQRSSGQQMKQSSFEYTTAASRTKSRSLRPHKSNPNNPKRSWPNEISLHLVYKKMADDLAKSLPFSEDDKNYSNEGGWQKVKDLVAERFE